MMVAMTTAKAKRFKVGGVECASLFDNERSAALSMIFPNVDAEDLARAKEAYAINSDDVPVGFNLLYLNLDEQHVLVDAGFGNAHLLESIAKLELSPEDINKVIITHSDGDHIGGLGDFINAQIVMPQQAWDLWSNAASRAAMVEEFIKLFRGKIPEDELEARAASREKHGAETLPSLKDRVELVDADVEVMTGLKFIGAAGHRSDHFALELSSQGETLIHGVDSIRHPLQANYDWPSFIDSYPEQVVKTNKVLLKRILEKDALLFGSHFPFPALAKISEKEQTRVWEWLN